MERLVILPFSIGCVSQTSVDVGSSKRAAKSACRGIAATPLMAVVDRGLRFSNSGILPLVKANRKKEERDSPEGSRGPLSPYLLGSSG